MTAVLATGDSGGTGNGALLVAILLALALLARAGARLGKPGHGHGDRAHVARHEAAHAVAARAVGGRVESATVSAGDRPSGLVRWRLPAGSEREHVEANIAFLAAGGLAAPGSGCSGDQAAIRDVLRRLPRDERAGARRAGERRAAQIVAARRAEIDRAAARLQQEGRL